MPAGAEKKTDLT